jgi:hypothetical protein
MAVVKLEALKALRCAILAGVPDLSEEAINPWAVAPNVKKQMPGLAFVPARFAYYPDQAEAVYDPAPDCVVMNVGRHEATVQLRLVHASAVGRAEIQDKIIDLFLGTPLHPGVLLTPVVSAPQFGNFLAAWELGDETWQDEDAQGQEYWSYLTILGQIPALVTRGAHRIRDLRLGLTEDFDTTFTPSNFATAEVVRINADGTMTPL